MAKKRSSPFDFSTSARRKLEGLATRHLLPAKTVATRVIEWLANQPELIQCAVLGKFPETIDKELAKLIIREITR